MLGQHLLYSTNLTRLQGYFAYDNSTDAKRGLVIIVPDW